MSKQYQLMIRTINVKTKQVISDKKEMCMFPNDKHIVRNAARKNGCYNLGNNIIRHSYAKMV